MTATLSSILQAENLEHLLTSFTDQGVTDSILSDLSDSDLKDLGIDKLGERKRLLSRFSQNLSQDSPAQQPPLSESLEEQSTEAIEPSQPTTPQDQFTYDARNGEIVITGFRGKGHVVVPAAFDDLPLPVRIIGEKAFFGNGMLVSVVLPDGLREIGNEAFKDCSSLTSVTIPDSVSCEGAEAFYGCSSLFRSPLNTFPDGATNIRNYAFTHRDSLKSIIIPEGVINIGNCAFLKCTELTSITIPDSVTSIGNKAFRLCKELISITIPESVTEIEGDTFDRCRPDLRIIRVKSSKAKPSIPPPLPMQQKKKGFLGIFG